MCGVVCDCVCVYKPVLCVSQHMISWHTFMEVSVCSGGFFTRSGEWISHCDKTPSLNNSITTLSTWAKSCYYELLLFVDDVCACMYCKLCVMLNGVRSVH